MLVTDFTRKAHAYRRFARLAEADGFEPISEGSDHLWRLARGGCYDCHIVGTRIAPDGHEVWIKIEHHCHRGEAA